MSDIMLLGVLRMPISSDCDTLTFNQFVDRARQAADQIETLTKQRDMLMKKMKDMVDSGVISSEFDHFHCQAIIKQVEES